MATVGLLCVFLLQALDATAEIVRGCDPGVPKNQPVDSCNYYCKDLGGGNWMMGYYTNGTKCKLDNNPDGVCLDLGPEKEGCYPEDSPEVKDFFGNNMTTQPSVPEPIPPESGTGKTKTEKTKSSKKKKSSKSKSKKSKKSKKDKKTKDEKTKDKKKRTKNKKQENKERKNNKCYERTRMVKG
uniref:Putative basic tail protein n=1 Tax=Amblyomma triste TaxID=251400 RepID=A0A023GCT4_AMBTT